MKSAHPFNEYLALCALIALVISASTTDAYAQSTAEHICRRVDAMTARVEQKGSACGMSRPGGPEASTYDDCLAQFEGVSCLPESLAWWDRYFDAVDACVERAPVCEAGNAEAWTREHLGPCISRVHETLPAPPDDQRCRLSGMPVMGPFPVPVVGAAPQGGSQSVEPNPSPPTSTADHFVMRRDGSSPPRRSQLSLLGVFGSYGASTVGVGGFFSLPIVPTTGLWNDALHLEFGAQLGFVFYGFGTGQVLQFLGGVRYDIHVLERLTAYIAARTGPALALRFGNFGWFFGSAVGVQYQLSDRLALRGEASGGTATGAAFSIGASFLF